MTETTPPRQLHLSMPVLIKRLEKQLRETNKNVLTLQETLNRIERVVNGKN